MISSKIAVLIPCLNESQTIGKVVKDFKRELPESDIYVCDNNSTDCTYEEAQKAGAIVLSEYQRGKGAVIRNMFNAIEADIYIMVDGDDTYPAEEIHKLLSAFKDKNGDMVIGDRLSNNSYFEQNKRFLHSFGNIMTRKFVNIIFRAHLKDIMSGYRVFSRRFVKTYPVLYQGFELETDMTIFALHHRIKILEEQITYRDRPQDSYSKLHTFKDGFNVIATVFNLYRFYKPLGFFGLVSLLFLIIGISIGIPVVGEYIQFRYVYKVPSAILATGLLLFSLLWGWAWF